MNKNKDAQIRILLFPLRVVQLLILLFLSGPLYLLAHSIFLLLRSVEYICSFGNNYEQKKLDGYPFKKDSP
jgi:hypothetical protein